jgi:hypothetical protein
VEIATASSDYFKVQVQQTSCVLLTERVVSFVFSGSVVEAVTFGAISHESFGTCLFLCPEIEQQVVTANKSCKRTLFELRPSFGITWKDTSWELMFSREHYSAFW